MADKKYKLNFEMSNGATESVQFTVPQGEKGDVGAPGAHIGAEAPTDGQQLWIDTEDDADGEGSAQIDVVANVGQVIAVKAVDTNGKPTEYKAVDLPQPEQPDWNAAEGEAGHILNRTHYVDENGVIHKLPNKFIDADWMATSEDGGAGKVVFIPEQTIANNAWRNLQADLVVGDKYAVEVNGILHECVCRSYDGTLYLGNGTLFDEGVSVQSNEPFCLAWAGGAATGGFFYTDGTLEAPIGIKVSDWQDTVYNQLPEEFLPEISWNNLTDRPLEKDIGELLFSQTVTFATDDAATTGTRVTANGLTLTKGVEYWLEINGDMVKCRCESSSASGWTLYDAEGNMPMKRSVGYIYIYGQTAGTYTYNLYRMAKNIVLDPQYIPSNIARKSDIPDVSGVVKSVNNATPDENGNVTVEIPESTGGGVDVTASVGQTIRVKAVDADGKPTEWEAVDLQEKICGEGLEELFSENGVFVGGESMLSKYIALEAGETYYVKWNGVDYTCVAYEGGGDIWIGNYEFAEEGEPFVIVSLPGDVLTFAISTTDETYADIVISKNGNIQIPEHYLRNAMPFYFTAQISQENPEYSLCYATVEQFKTAYENGREIKLKLAPYGDGFTYFGDLSAVSSNGYGYCCRFLCLGVTANGLITFTAQEDGTFAISLSNS